MKRNEKAMVFSLLVIALLLVPVYAASEQRDCAGTDIMCRIQKIFSNLGHGNIDKQRNISRECTQCSDGTACSQTSIQNMTCRCTDTDRDSKMEACILQRALKNETSDRTRGWNLKNCSSCNDGTPCGQKNSRNMTCTCRDVNNDARTEFCYIQFNIPMRTAHRCVRCSDGTECGANNTRNFTCDCRDLNRDSGNDICILRRMPQPIPACTSCADGTPCGENNTANASCICRDVDRDNETELCFLNRQSRSRRVGCSSCLDGTPCNQTSSRGLSCECRDSNRDGTNETCLMVMRSWPRNRDEDSKNGGVHGFPSCTQCRDGTPCGQTSSRGWDCTCRDINRDGRNETCSSLPNMDSNSTDCLTLNCNSTMSSRCEGGVCNVSCGGEARDINCSSIVSRCDGSSCRVCCIQAMYESTYYGALPEQESQDNRLTLEGCLYRSSDSSMICSTNCVGGPGTRMVVVDLQSGKIGLAMESPVKLGSVEYLYDDWSASTQMRFRTAKSEALSSEALSSLGADTSEWIVTLYCSNPSGSAKVLGVSRF